MGVLSDEDLVAMRARARHRLIGALALVVLLIVGVPLLIDRRDPPSTPPQDEVDGSHAATEEAKLPPQPSTVTPLGADVAPPPSNVGAPDPAKSEPATSESAKPETAKPDLAKPDLAKPDPAKPAEGLTPSPTGGPAKSLDGAVSSAPPALAESARTAEPAQPAKASDAAHMTAPAPVPDTIPPLAIQAPARHAEAAKDAKDAKDSKAAKDARDARESKDAKDARDAKESKAAKDARDSKTAREANDTRGGKGSKDAPISASKAPSASPAADSKAGAAHGWFVQFGFFADAARAESLAKRLESQGIRVHDEVLQTPKGARTRLRSGPFGARSEADEVLARARTLGENAFLVHQ